MKKYISPITSVVKIETSILCASGFMPIAPKGNLESIDKSTGSW